MIYCCQFCNYSTIRKSDLKKHLKRKKPCSKNKLSFDLLQQEEKKKTESFSEKNDAEYAEIDAGTDAEYAEIDAEYAGIFGIKNSQICEFCEKKFSSISTLNRHKSKNCKYNPDLSSEGNRLWMKKLAKKDEIIKELRRDKKELYKVIEEVASKASTINNNVTQNIIINNYGNEDISYIKDNYMTDLLKIPFAAIPKMVKDIHFHPEHPENHNILITNKKEPYIKVFKNSKWMIEDKKGVLDELVDKSYDILGEHYDGVEENLKDYEKNRFINFQNRYENIEGEQSEVKKKCTKDVEILVINESNNKE